MELVSSGNLLSLGNADGVELTKRRWSLSFTQSLSENAKLICFLKLKESSAEVDFASFAIDPQYPSYFQGIISCFSAVFIYSFSYILENNSYGVPPIVDKNATYSFNESKFFFQLFKKGEEDAFNRELMSIGFEELGTPLIFSGLNILRLLPNGRMVLNGSFQAGKGQFFYFFFFFSHQ